MLRAFLAHLPHPAWVKDLQGRYLDVNPAFELAHGVRRADLLGRGDEDLVGPAAAARARARERAAAERREPQSSRERLVRDGVRSECVVLRFPLLDGEGGVIATGGVATDVTRLALARRELRALQEGLRRARRALAAAPSAALAHDLGNILLSVGGYAELALRRLPPADEAAALLHEVLAATARARELLERMAGPGLLPRWGRLDPGALAAEAVRLLQGQAAPDPAAGGVDIRARGAAPAVVGDAPALVSVLLNLGRNALAAMPAGGCLRLDLRAHANGPGAPAGDAPHGWTVLAVSDSGPGIAPAMRERVFEPGFTTRAPDGGRGLGLWSARETARAHGGELRVLDTPGPGSTFELWLPAAAPAPADRPLTRS